MICTNPKYRPTGEGRRRHTLSCMCIAVQPAEAGLVAGLQTRTCSSRAITCQTQAWSIVMPWRVRAQRLWLRCALCAITSRPGRIGTPTRTVHGICCPVLPLPRLPTANHRTGDGIVIAAAVPREAGQVVIRRSEVMVSLVHWAGLDGSFVPDWVE